MKTLEDLPKSDPSIFRIYNDLWIGDVKIKTDTVLNKEFIRSKIIMFKGAYICNSWEADLVTQSIMDLEKLLEYLL